MRLSCIRDAKDLGILTIVEPVAKLSANTAQAHLDLTE